MQLNQCYSFFILLVSPEGFSSISPVNNVTLNRGDDITLQCNTTAGPDNKHNWFHKATEQVCCPNGENVNITGTVSVSCLMHTLMHSLYCIQIM